MGLCRSWEGKDADLECESFEEVGGRFLEPFGSRFREKPLYVAVFLLGVAMPGRMIFDAARVPDAAAEMGRESVLVVVVVR